MKQIMITALLDLLANKEHKGSYKEIADVLEFITVLEQRSLKFSANIKAEGSMIELEIKLSGKKEDEATSNIHSPASSAKITNIHLPLNNVNLPILTTDLLKTKSVSQSKLEGIEPNLEYVHMFTHQDTAFYRVFRNRQFSHFSFGLNKIMPDTYYTAFRRFTVNANMSFEHDRYSYFLKTRDGNKVSYYRKAEGGSESNIGIMLFECQYLQYLRDGGKPIA